MVAALGGSVEGGAARAGAYRRKTLAARFGDMALPDVLIALTACERRGVEDYPRPVWACGLCLSSGPLNRAAQSSRSGPGSF
jgi:hypothetical protein